MRSRGEWIRDALHLVILGCLVAQPVLDVLARNAEFFVAHRADPADVVLLVLVVCLALPVLGLGLEVVAGLLGAGVRRGMHAAVVGGLAALASLPLLLRVPGFAAAPALWAVLGGGGLFAVLYHRVGAVRSFVTALSPALVVVPGLFLFASPVRQIVFPPADPSAAAVRVERPAPVVVVVFDELPLTSLLDGQGRIDASRFPHLATFATDATWYRAATTVADFTAFAVPALLTGRYPSGGGLSHLPTAADHPRSLFTLLGGTYDLHVSETLTHVCPSALCGPDRSAGSRRDRVRGLVGDVSIVALHVFLPPDLRARLPDIGHAWRGFARERQGGAPSALVAMASRGLEELRRDRAAQFAAFVEGIRASEKPALHFVHILLPHGPQEYLPSGKRYLTGSSPGDREPGIAWREEAAAVEGYQRHLLQLGFVDTLVGSLIARLRALDLYDAALVIVTADHGVSYRKGQAFRNVSRGNACDVMPVPLLVKAPHQRAGGTSDANVELIDVLPTIADLIGIRLTWEVDGRSLAAADRRERSEKVIFGLGGNRLAFEYPLRCEDAVQRKVMLFGAGNGWDGLFAAGPMPSLVGREVASLDVADDGGLRVALEGASLYARVEPGGAFLPARVSGKLLAGREPVVGRRLAVAVNGTVRAVTETFRDLDGDPAFSALVPEAAFRPGANAVDVFLVSGDGEALALRRAGSSGARTWALGHAGGTEALLASDGVTIRIEPDAVAGAVELIDVEGGRVWLRGWAADVAHDEPAEVIVLIDGRFAHAGATSVRRPDRSPRDRPPATGRSGFQFVVDVPNERPALRVFAVSRQGAASELARP